MSSEVQAIQAAPASDALLDQIVYSIAERRNHTHPEEGKGPDLHCMNLVAYMGEQMEFVLVRLAAAEAERDDLTGQVAGRDATIQRVLDVARKAAEEFGLLRPAQILRAVYGDPAEKEGQT